MKRLFILLLIPLLVGTSSFAQIIRLGAIADAPPGGPTISTSGSFTTFSSTTGTPSASQSITLSGSALTNSVVATSPGTWLELSKDNSSWSSSLTFTVSGGSIPSQPVLVYARSTAVVGAGSYSGNISLVSSPATTVNIAAAASITSSGTAHYRTITVDHTKVPNTDQANFPVLVTGTYTYLKTIGNGGKVQNASGFDIYFSSDAGGTSILPFERVVWGATTGTCEFWVNVTSLSHTTDNVIYMQYGNTGITTDQSNRTGTWNSNYQAVYHLANGSTLTAADATTNAVNGSIAAATATTGQIDGAASFSSSSAANISLGNNLGIIGDITIEAWINPANFSFDHFILAKGNSAPNPYSLVISSSTGLPTFFMGNGAGGSIANVSGTTGLTVSAWNHVVVTRSGLSVSQYLNGNTNGSSGSFNPTIVNGTDNTYIGIKGNATFGMDGLIDEVRISNFVRSADWVKTEYNNMNSPSTFYTVGVEN